MAYKYRKLKGKITEVYGTQSEFAKALSLSENSLSKKLNCKTGLSQNDMILWSKLLGIDKSDFGEYFFA